MAGVDMEELAARRMRYSVQALRFLAEYLEVLGPVLQAQGVAVVLALLQRWRARPAWLPDILGLIASLLAHRRCAHTCCAGNVSIVWLTIMKTPSASNFP